MDRSEPRDQNGNQIRTARIPEEKDAVWEDGSGDEARAREREDVKGAPPVPGQARTRSQVQAGKTRRTRRAARRLK